MFNFFSKQETAIVNRDNGVVADSTIKTRANLKSHTSRGYQMMSIFTIFIFSLFVMITLQSCDKAKALDGTTWDGNGSFSYTEYGCSSKGDGTISISLTAGSADVSAKFKVKDCDSDTWNETYKGSGTYTYDKGNITLNIKWKENEDAYPEIDDIDNGKWTGTVDTKAGTMNLKNVFGESVTFKK